MIAYNPNNGDPLTHRIEYKPRTCLLMTKLGASVSEGIQTIRAQLAECLNDFQFRAIDAESEVTGKDLLEKIWKLILAVPLGIAIVHKDMNAGTLGNVFYEVGMMHAYGKETLIVKQQGMRIPSDLVRTEYVEYGDAFDTKISMYMRNVVKLGEHYGDMAENFAQGNPLLAIDYLRRAYLILGDSAIQTRKAEILSQMKLDGRTRNSVEGLLSTF